MEKIPEETFRHAGDATDVLKCGNATGTLHAKRTLQEINCKSIKQYEIWSFWKAPQNLQVENCWL